MSIKRHNAGPRMSQGVVHNNTVYVAGQVSDEAPTAKGQTQAILRKIDEILAACGSHKSKLLSTTIYLSNMAYYSEMNEAWDAWVEAGSTPARATVEARLAAPRFLVEIMVVAAV